MQIPRLGRCGYYHSYLSGPALRRSNVRAVREYEIEYIRADGGTFLVDGRALPMMAGTVLVCKPGEHRQSLLTRPLVTTYLRITAEGVLAERLLSLPTLITPREGSEIEQMMDEIVFHAGSASELFLSGKLLLLIDALQLEAEGCCPMTAFAARMHRARAFIEGHFREQIKTEDAARSVFLSESHFRSSFRSHFGITPHDYLLHLRMEEAKRLLAGSACSVGEIALLTCLGSAKNFSTLFRKETGMTPSAFRRAVLHQYAE